jgi:hypothetical protein
MPCFYGRLVRIGKILSLAIVAAFCAEWFYRLNIFIICFAEHIEWIIKRPSETFQTAFGVESAIKTADFQIKLRCRNRCGGAGHPGLVRGRGRL